MKFSTNKINIVTTKIILVDTWNPNHDEIVPIKLGIASAIINNKAVNVQNKENESCIFFFEIFFIITIMYIKVITIKKILKVIDIL